MHVIPAATLPVAIIMLVAVPWDGAMAAGSVAGGAVDSVLEFGRVVSAGVTRAYLRVPEMVVGLGLALMLPVLAIVSLVVRRLSSRRQGDPVRSRPRPTGGTSPVARAWIEIADGGHPRNVEVAGELMRIGRDGDNEVVLDGRKVEACHALIRRTPEAEFVIIDVSGVPEGVAVNGRCLARSALKGGDRIDVGGVAVTFHRERRAGNGGAGSVLVN